MVIPVSLLHFNLLFVFYLYEYGNLGEISCPVHIKQFFSFCHLLMVLSNRQRPHMHVIHEQDVRTVHVNFVCWFVVWLIPLSAKLCLWDPVAEYSIG